MEFREKSVRALKQVLDAAIESGAEVAKAPFRWAWKLNQGRSANDPLFKVIARYAHRRYRAKRGVKTEARSRTYQQRMNILRFEEITRAAASLLGCSAVHPATSHLFPCAKSFNPPH